MAWVRRYVPNEEGFRLVRRESQDDVYSSGEYKRQCKERTHSPRFKIGTLLEISPVTKALAKGSWRYPASTADRRDVRASLSVS